MLCPRSQRFLSEDRGAVQWSSASLQTSCCCPYSTSSREGGHCVGLGRSVQTIRGNLQLFDLLQLLGKNRYVVTVRELPSPFDAGYEDPQCIGPCRCWAEVNRKSQFCRRKGNVQPRHRSARALSIDNISWKTWHLDSLDIESLS